jgi:hypothetical protein
MHSFPSDTSFREGCCPTAANNRILLDCHRYIFANIMLECSCGFAGEAKIMSGRHRWRAGLWGC